VTGARSWRGLPELYRGNGVFLTASPDQAHEQLACGARVVGPVGSSAEGSSAGAAEIATELAAASSASPLTAGGARAGLREIFEAHATPVKLAGITRAAGLPAAMVGGRAVSVLATVDSAAAARRLAAAQLGQRMRPAEVIAGAPEGQAAAVTEALGALRDAGIRVRVTTVAGDVPGTAESGTAGAGTGGLARLAALASSPWVAPWPGGEQRDAASSAYLLDLACARECAQADAVGFGTSPDGGDFQFTQRLAVPALARRELFLPGSPAPDTWGTRGFRTFLISAAAIGDAAPREDAAPKGNAPEGTVALEGTH
jgi:hypothetical protein